MRFSISQVAQLSLRTIDGFSIVSLRTSLPSRENLKSSGLKGITRRISKISRSGRELMLISRTGSSTRRWCGDDSFGEIDTNRENLAHSIRYHRRNSKCELDGFPITAGIRAMTKYIHELEQQAVRFFQILVGEPALPMRSPQITVRTFYTRVFS